MHIAIATRADLALTQILLEVGHNPNMTFSTVFEYDGSSTGDSYSAVQKKVNWTLLSYVAKRERRNPLGFTKLLCEHGADVNKGASKPLLFAIERRLFKVVGFLISQGADPFSPTEVVRKRCRDHSDGVSYYKEYPTESETPFDSALEQRKTLTRQINFLELELGNKSLPAKDRDRSSVLLFRMKDQLSQINQLILDFDKQRAQEHEG